MVVEKGDMVSMRVKDGTHGYYRGEVLEDGIYLGPDHPFITLTEIEGAIKELKRLKLRRQYEKDKSLEDKYSLQNERLGVEGDF